MDSAFSSNYILLINDMDDSEFKLDSRMLPFSDFLSQMSEEPHQDPLCIMTINLPSFLQTTRKSLEIMMAFYAVHHFQAELIKVQRLKTSNYEKSMDCQSLAYLKETLKPLTAEETKGLLNLTQYLKLHHLKDIICLFLASQYFLNYNEIEMKRRLAERKIEYSRQADIDLARKSWGFAKQMSVELLEQLTLQEERKHKKQ